MAYLTNSVWTLRKHRRRLMDGEWPSYVDPGLGELWVWGINGNGQLGDGTTTQKSSPVQIAGTTWSQVACGNRCTAAIKTDGTLWAWGDNQYGHRVS